MCPMSVDSKFSNHHHHHHVQNLRQDHKERNVTDYSEGKFGIRKKKT